MEAHKDMNKYQRIGIRIAISASVGILVAAIAIVAAWRSIGSMWQVRPEQWTTRTAILELEKVVQMYHGTTKTLPKSLEELSISDEFRAYVPRDEKGRPLDAWGRPLLYSTADTKYVITSLGQDGKPGGIGLDCDLSNTNDWPDEARPTFRQFLTHPMTRGSARACLACAVLAFLLSLAMVDPSILQRYGVLPLVIQLGATILMTLIVAFFLGFAEIPNYH
jgi:general secretion pathway protein G